jgi:FtsZ-binding cell division protein ZapB
MDVIKDIAIVMGQLEIDDLKEKIKIMQENQLTKSHKSMKLYIDQSSKTSKLKT